MGIGEKLGGMLSKAVMPKDMKALQEAMTSVAVEGVSKKGFVKVSMNGRYAVQAVKIEPALLEQDKRRVEEYILAAINDAAQQVEKELKKNIVGMASKFN